MMRYLAIPVFLIFQMIVGTVGVNTAFAADDQRPNIIMIMCDDLGYGDVGFSGSPDINTPRLDELAKAGTICTSAYVCHPFCGPSRMGLMAGRYPHKFGAPYNLPPSHKKMKEFGEQGIPSSETMISTVLQRSGYTTGLVGKWHMGETPEFHPNNRGFDDFYGFLGGGHNYFPDRYRANYKRQIAAGKTPREYDVPLQHNGEPTTEDEYLTDALSKQAVRFIDEAHENDKPFFLFVAYNAPHAPMQAKKDDIAKYSHIKNDKRRVVAGMVAAVDRGVGMITDKLKSSGEFDNTLIVFLSDNGGKLVFGSSNEPFRGSKGDTFEGGFRSPMFFHWPGKMPAGKFDHPVTALDFYPTFAAAAGASVPEDQELDGVNLLESLQTGAHPNPGRIIYAMRHRGGTSDMAIRKDNWKLVRMFKQPWRLIDLPNDPTESNDMAAEHPELVAELLAAGKLWSETHLTPIMFDSTEAYEDWKSRPDPCYSEIFVNRIGAGPLKPVVHITDTDGSNQSSGTKGRRK